MKKIKIAIAILFFLIFMSFVPINFVEANNENSLDENQNFLNETINKNSENNLETEEEKIMKYDRTTGETTVVDMEELEKELKIKDRAVNNLPNCTQAYNPHQNNGKVKLITPRSTFMRTDVTSFPYTAICRLKYDIYGEEGTGAGAVVAPRVVLTAAHCVMNRDDSDNFFAQWNAYPGYQNGSSYNGLGCGWSKIYYSSLWKTTHFNQYDWCICILYDEIGTQSGWLGCQSYGTNYEMDGLSIETVGYPSTMDLSEYQYSSKGNITNVYNLYILSNAGSEKGMSGGPVMRTSDNYIVAVNRGRLDEKEFGVRITQEMINIIKNEQNSA